MQHCSTSNNNLSLSTVALAASIRDDKAGKSPEERVVSDASALLHFPGTLSNELHNKRQHTCVLACLKRRLPHVSPLNLWSKMRVGQKRAYVRFKHPHVPNAFKASPLNPQQF